MALVDVPGREIRAKIVYYGPGLGGKTTNLRYLYDRIPAEAKGRLVSIASGDERTLFFDFLPLDLGRLHGFAVRFQLYTVPGQNLYERTRRTVLSGADGAVFVADAQRDRLEDNAASLRELTENVAAQGKTLGDLPLVLQYNKMDLPAALPAAALDRQLNRIGAPRVEASAIAGQGVVETLRLICKLVAA